VVNSGEYLVDDRQVSLVGLAQDSPQFGDVQLAKHVADARIPEVDLGSQPMEKDVRL
jgi:hypothetical protein